MGLRSRRVILVALLGTLLSLAGWLAATRWVEARLKDRIGREADAVASAMQDRINAYAEVTHGLQSLFESSPGIARGEFQRYLDRLALRERFPGVQLIAFARHVRAVDKAGYEARVRRQLQAQDRSGFVLHPAGERDEYLPYEYVWPQERGASWLGLDLLTEPAWLASCRQACDSEGLVVSDRLTPPDVDPEPKYALMGAVRASGLSPRMHGERRAALTGAVSLVFSITEVLRDLVTPQQIQAFDVEIFEDEAAARAGERSRLVFDASTDLIGTPHAQHAAGAQPQYQVQRTIRIGQREWRLVLQALPSFLASQPERWLPLLVLAGGLVGTFLLTLLAGIWVAESLRIRGRLEEKLIASEAKFRNTYEHAALGIAYARLDGRFIEANQKMCGIVGYTNDELAHKTISELTHPDDLADDRALKATLLSGETPSYTMEKRYLRKNGEPVWVSVTVSLIRNAEGEPDYMVAIIEDVHLRKLGSLALQTLNTSTFSSGEAVLRQVVQMLATLLDVEFAVVTEMAEASNRRVKIRTLWADGGFAPDFSFDLQGTVCGALVEEASPLFEAQLQSAPLIVADHVQQRFPDDARLAALGAQSYGGVALRSTLQAPLGTLAVMSRRPMRNPEATAMLLQLLAVRISNELERERESKKFLDLFNHSPSAIIMLDAQGTIHLASHACEAMFGWASHVLIGQDINVLFPEDQRQAYWALNRRFADGGLTEPAPSVQQDIWCWRRDGSTFPSEISLSRLDTVSGAMTVAYVFDITERKRVQDAQQRINQKLEAMVLWRTQELERANLALANKEEEVRSVLEHMTDGVVGIDEKGTIIAANPAITRILGYAVDEMIGRNVSMLMPEPYRSAHDSYLERYAQTGEARIIGTGREFEGLHKNGERIDLELSVSEYLIRGKRFFTGTLRDIRERLRLLRTLEQARLDAEQANRAKSAFLATMSHEIRTPMNGVIGMIDVLEQSSLTDPQVDIVKTIRDSAYSLLTIVDDVLDFSKIEAGQFQIDCAPMAPAQIVEGACDTLDVMASRAGVELTLFTEPALPGLVLGDAARLRQVLINLTGNAIKFSSGPGRAGQVSVRAMRIDKGLEPAMLELRVSDNGIGMDQEAQSRLFQPFTQADSSTTRRFGGTGLGLSISHRLVALMGGSIVVQSEPDKGAVFSVRLPLMAVSASLEAKASDQELTLAGLSCLVLGDPAGLADDLAVYLTHSGASVARVQGLVAAREWLGRQPPGLCIGVIDGKGLALDELRAACREWPHLKARFVVIERGRRRTPRFKAADLVVLDGNVMHRGLFLEAVALVAGRITAATGTDRAGGSRVMPAAQPRKMERSPDKLILVAEDNTINQKVVLKQLEMLGFTAEIANHGREALERWRHGHYALLLTDLNMPEMDGYELTRAIREAETGAQRLPIVALTANAVRGEAQRCRDIGMDDYLTKPVQMVNLKAMLDKWLSAAAPDKPVSDLPPPPALKAAESMLAVDVSFLKALVGDDPADLREFLLDFRSSAAQTAGEMRWACQLGQASVAGAMAHKLKSSARSVGAMVLGELCAQMEELGQAGRIEALVELLPRFEAEIARVDQYVETV